MRAFVTALALTCLAATAATAKEVCENQESAPDAGTVRLCVSSVLPPQAGRDYGPLNLMGTTEEGGAWCEGARGGGAGESITMYFKPATRVRAVVLANGYTRTEDTFRRNGRIKRARVETSGGHKANVTLKDIRDEQRIAIPTGMAEWVRITILDVYPGIRSSDTCVTEFSVDFGEDDN